jgi:hypothetical protein
MNHFILVFIGRGATFMCSKKNNSFWVWFERERESLAMAAKLWGLKSEKKSSC